MSLEIKVNILKGAIVYKSVNENDILPPIGNTRVAVPVQDLQSIDHIRLSLIGLVNLSPYLACSQEGEAQASSYLDTRYPEQIVNLFDFSNDILLHCWDGLSFERLKSRLVDPLGREQDSWDKSLLQKVWCGLLPTNKIILVLFTPWYI